MGSDFVIVAPPRFDDPGAFPKGYNTTNIERNFTRGYSRQYSFAAQRELPGGLLAEESAELLRAFFASRRD